MKMTLMDMTASSGWGMLAAKALLMMAGAIGIGLGIAALFADRARQLWEIHRGA